MFSLDTDFQISGKSLVIYGTTFKPISTHPEWQFVLKIDNVVYNRVATEY